jgi:DNA-directed RNA polymerase specialized sigma24 family protein
MGQEDQDTLLRRFLSEEDSTLAQVCLEKLFSEHVEPLVRDITRYKSRANCGSVLRNEAQDEEDIRSEVVLHLISRLRDLRISRAQAPIHNFRGYVAATTYNVYYKYVRMKYPARWRLKNRMRYLLNHKKDFAIWQDEHQEYLCGLAMWGKHQTGIEVRPENQQLNLDEFIYSLTPGKGVAQMDLAELVMAILDRRGHPIQIDEIVGIVAELQGISDLQPASQYAGEKEEGSGVSVCDLLPDPDVDIVTKLGARSDLERLWMEICQLPQRQRVALLLNLRDAQARDALILLTFTGIASLRRIAEVLELPLEEFTGLWNKLPLEDTAIATLLGITRQQVINLRKSARERLSRRMIAPRSRKEEVRE